MQKEVKIESLSLWPVGCSWVNPRSYSNLHEVRMFICSFERSIIRQERQLQIASADVRELRVCFMHCMAIRIILKLRCWSREILFVKIMQIYLFHRTRQPNHLLMFCLFLFRWRIIFLALSKFLPVCTRHSFFPPFSASFSLRKNKEIFP